MNLADLESVSSLIQFLPTSLHVINDALLEGHFPIQDQMDIMPSLTNERHQGILLTRNGCLSLQAHHVPVSPPKPKSASIRCWRRLLPAHFSFLKSLNTNSAHTLLSSPWSPSLSSSPGLLVQIGFSWPLNMDRLLYKDCTHLEMQCTIILCNVTVG
jgi:hypothetical protein